MRASIRLGRVEAARDEAERLARIGRDRGYVNRADFGHGILQEAMRDQAGILLRGPEVEIELDARDPAAPLHRIQRARRVDPLATLLALRSITQREYDAGERLRRHVEQAQPSLSGSRLLCEVRVAGAFGAGINERQLNSWRAARRALGEVNEAQLSVLAWIVLGRGSIDGYARHARMRRATVPELLRGALGRLADHYYGPADRRVAA